MRTRTGEPTVEVRQWKLLSKSLRPLPEKWHGLVDVEARYRRRYLDLISNEEARRIATLRSRVVSALRRMMDARGFMEVETPMLVSVPAGGTATPFSTHYRALNRDLFLRIATELYLKKLVIGGLEKVYEIGRIFRNEGVDLTHNPEFTTMESYEAFADYSDVMRMVEELVHGIAVDVTGSATVTAEGECIDLTPPWPRRTLRDEVRDRSGIDFLECPDIESLGTEMKRIGLDVGRQVSWGGLLDKLLSDTVEPHLVQPTFLVDYPVEMSPLAKKRADDERLVERFEGFAAGMEICNAFTELNDPVDQRERMEQQEALNLQYRDEEMDRLERGLPAGPGARDASDRRAGRRNRPPRDAVHRATEHPRGGALSPAQGRLTVTETSQGQRAHCPPRSRRRRLSRRPAFPLWAPGSCRAWRGPSPLSGLGLPRRRRRWAARQGCMGAAPAQ